MKLRKIKDIKSLITDELQKKKQNYKSFNHSKQHTVQKQQKEAKFKSFNHFKQHTVPIEQNSKF